MFGIENSRDRLLQLKNDFGNLQKDALNISLAEKTCSDAWHLIDWVLIEEQRKHPELTKHIFRIRVYRECPEMKILHDLVNTFKHRELTNPKVQIKETRKHGGAFSSVFSKAFDVSRLEIHFENNDKIYIDDLIKKVIKYWDDLIH